MYTIIGRSECKWCDKTVDLLETLGEEYKYIKIEDNKWLISLMAKAGFTTVPLIFSPSNRCVGGFLDLEELIFNGPL
jgi:glutaredoxin